MEEIKEVLDVKTSKTEETETEPKEKVEEQKPVEGETPKPEPQEKDPVEKELEKVKNKKVGKRDRLVHANKKIKDQLTDLDVEEGIEPSIAEGDDEPLTVGKYNELKKEDAKKTAIQLADDITDEKERELTKHYLNDRIVPSGNPKADLSLARGMVNQIKNTQIVEELERKTQVTPGSTAPGAPASKPEAIFEPTADELVFMSPPYNVSKEDIIETRKKAEK